MLLFNLRLIFRNFKKNKSSFLINVFGLSTGFAFAFLISLWVLDEVNIDKFHYWDKQLYQVMENHQTPNGITTQEYTPDLLARTISEEMDEVKYSVAVMKTDLLGKFTVDANGRNTKANGQFAEPDFFKVFSFDLVVGNKENVLTNREAVIISKKIANTLFHSTENALGKTLSWQLFNFKKTAVVTGVFEYIPSNSTSQFDFVLSYEAWLDFCNALGRKIHWNNHAPCTYVVMKEGVDIDRFNEKLHDYLKTKSADQAVTLFAVPFSSRYLYGKYENGIQTGGKIDYINLFVYIGIFILLIAGINFVNLSTARAFKRFKEIGIKKIIGSSRKTLVFQLIGESIIVSIFSFFAALILVFLLLPHFNTITGKHLSMALNSQFIFITIGVSLVTAILSGLYPAFYITKSNATEILKAKKTSSIGELWLRKGLVVFQFSISLVLLTSFLFLQKQINFIQKQNLGYKQDNIIFFSKEGALSEKQDAFIDEIKNITGVINAASLGGNLLGSSGTTDDVTWSGKGPNSRPKFEMLSMGYGLIETLGIVLKEGRTYSNNYGNESNNIILNEAAVQTMGLKDPVGQTIRFWGEVKQIVGVVNNFHFQSLHEKINPLIFTFDPERTLNIMVKIEAGKERETLALIESKYKEFNPGSSFDYQFLDAAYQALYMSEQRVSSLAPYFAGLGIIISCLGLLGLSSFAAEQRVKEIGVRKVNGAKIWEVLVMLNQDFVKWIALAFIISCPIVWFSMDKWLQSFAYKIELHWWIFGLAGFLALLVALLTISWQSWKAATRNPVEALRYE